MYSSIITIVYVLLCHTVEPKFLSAYKYIYRFAY